MAKRSELRKVSPGRVRANAELRYAPSLARSTDMSGTLDIIGPNPVGMVGSWGDAWEDYGPLDGDLGVGGQSLLSGPGHIIV